MEVQAWVGNVNIAASTIGAAPAEWRNYQYPSSYTTQESMSWPYSGNYHYASLANNNILGTEPGVHTSYPFAASNTLNTTERTWFSMLIDLGNDYNLSDLQAIVVYNRKQDNANGDRIQGFKPQLLDSGMNIVYDGNAFTGRDYYHRVNGPAWSSVSSSLLTTSENEFATKIINISSNTGIVNTTVYNTFTSSTEGYNIEQPFNGNLDGYTGVISKDNEWHHIVLSFDKINDNVKLFIDGTEYLSTWHTQSITGWAWDKIYLESNSNAEPLIAIPNAVNHLIPILSDD